MVNPHLSLTPWKFFLRDKIAPSRLQVSFLLLTVSYNSPNLALFSSIIFFKCP